MRNSGPEGGEGTVNIADESGGDALGVAAEGDEAEQDTPVAGNLV